tara:strand:- start:59 stop:781 length:723 start_codon:yes stop_codon:yes gene_type:complete
MTKYEIVKDPTTGLRYRPDMKELFIIEEVQREYKNVIFKDKTVLDAGAHIGASVYVADREGAKKIWAYEPMPDTFKILESNWGERENIQLENYALIGTHEKSLDFYIHPKYSSCNSSTKSNRKIHIKVKALNFWDEVAKHKPQILKIDIEGGEFDFMLKQNIPSYVEQVAIELHTTNNKRKRMAYEIIKKFNDWYANKSFSLKWYATVAIFSRKKIKTTDIKVKTFMEKKEMDKYIHSLK